MVGRYQQLHNISWVLLILDWVWGYSDGTWFGSVKSRVVLWGILGNIGVVSKIDQLTDRSDVNCNFTYRQLPRITPHSSTCPVPPTAVELWLGTEHRS